MNRKTFSQISKLKDGNGQYLVTSIKGGHKNVCSECGYTRISYNSCRNRHCTKCQTLSKER